jgi:hypothetical protein
VCLREELGQASLEVEKADGTTHVVIDDLGRQRGEGGRRGGGGGKGGTYCEPLIFLDFKSPL